MKTRFLCLAGLMLAAMAGQAQGAAVFLDFVSLPAGNVTTIGDATFSLAGVGEAGPPAIVHSFGGGLWNSTDNASYPTNSILRVDFSAPVSNLEWYFNNQGSKATSWTIYDSASSILATGANLTSGSVYYDLTAYSGVARIEWNNNGNDWLFNLNQLSYNSSSAVPEPASLAMWGLGAIGMMFARRKRQQKNLTA